MERKRIAGTLALDSWEAVDKALWEIGENELALAEIDRDMNQRLHKLKASAAEQAKPHQNRIDKVEKEIKEFVEKHREELGNKKTITLNFGECGFRQSTAIILPKAKERTPSMQWEQPGRARMFSGIKQQKKSLKKFDGYQSFGLHQKNPPGWICTV
jgi:phage host-nuclease inhibitor protein Gam